MKEYTLKVTMSATAYRVKAQNEKEAQCIVYDACKNHDFLVVETIESEVINEEDA